MNKLWISTLLLTLTTVVSAAPIFECTDSAGRKVYTQAGGKKLQSQQYRQTVRIYFCACFNAGNADFPKQNRAGRRSCRPGQSG